MHWGQGRVVEYAMLGRVVEYAMLFNILLLGCCKRYSCTLIKWYSLLSKITIPSIHQLYPIPSSDLRVAYWLISEDYISNLNWRQEFLCHNIHVFYIHLPIGYKYTIYIVYDTFFFKDIQYKLENLPKLFKLLENIKKDTQKSYLFMY